MGNGAARERAALPRARGACARQGGAGRRRPGLGHVLQAAGQGEGRGACLVRSFAGPPSSQAAQQNRCLDLVIRHFIRLEASSILVPIKKKSTKATYKMWDQTTKLSRLRAKFFFSLRSREACESVSE